MFGKGGVHEVGTVVFTVIAWGRRASAQNISFAPLECKRGAKTRYAACRSCGRSGGSDQFGPQVC
jgi:hypothetical protein